MGLGIAGTNRNQRLDLMLNPGRGGLWGEFGVRVLKFNKCTTGFWAFNIALITRRSGVQISPPPPNDKPVYDRLF